MKIIAEKKVFEEIEVCIPFYFTHYASGDTFSCTIYGKIDKHETLRIHYSESYTDHIKRYEVEVKSASPQSHSCYMKDEYKSSESEFNAARDRALEWISEKLGL